MVTHFVVQSETYAEKVKRLLAQYRFRYQVRKVTAAAGCSYQFTVSGEPSAVFALLSDRQIPYQTC